MGQTPAEAFFVTCDRETNPDDEIAAGRVTALIGIAPVKPAEFVVFRIAQFSGGAALSE
jgi:phage tail sheath protein FI